MRLQELTTSLTRSQLGVWAGDMMVRFRGNSRSCFTAWGQFSGTVVQGASSTQDGRSPEQPSHPWAHLQ